MAWTQERILGARGGVPLLFYCVITYTALHFARTGGREASFVLLLFKRRLSFFSGGSDGFVEWVWGGVAGWGVGS
jgi:hypothetical protein